MPPLSQQGRRALWIVLILVSIALLIVGCGHSSSSGSGTIGETLKWDQGQWDAVKWG